jgi:hypothetical protein
VELESYFSFKSFYRTISLDSGIIQKQRLRIKNTNSVLSKRERQKVKGKGRLCDKTSMKIRE